VSEVAPDEAALHARVDALLGEVLSAGPEAARNAKGVIRAQRSLPRANALVLTVKEAARQRVSPEGQEGLGAFLDNRSPSWREE
jgi:methylglutaconyl-CoA hydratase